MKQILLFVAVCSLLLAGKPSAGQGRQPVTTPEKQAALQLPFVGKRQFETRHDVSGTGTPHKFVEIKKNGDVYFYFEQVNQADGATTDGKYYAGKFSKYLKCTFKELKEGTIYYEIMSDKIYEVDAQHKRLIGEDCCSPNTLGAEDQCLCEGKLYAL